MAKKKNIMILAGIILLGALARFYQMKDSIFFVTDDWYTFKNCSAGISSLIQYWFSEGHFPAYFIMIHYWMKVFGTTEFAVRLPSLIFGVLSIYAVYLAGKKFFDEKTGLLAGFLFGISGINISFSQIAKPYSITEFFVLMSFLFLYNALEKNTRRLWAGYITVTLCALLLSPSALPVIICQMLFIKILWARYKKTVNFKNVIAGFFIIFLFYAPFLLKLITASFKDGKIMPLCWVQPPSLKTVIEIFSLFGGRVYMLGGAASQSSFILTGIFDVTLFLLCLKGIFSLCKSGEKENHAKAVYLSLWLGGPIILLYVFSMLVSPALGPVRYLLYISAAYYLLIAEGIMSFRGKMRILTAVFALTFSLMSLKQCHYALYRDYGIFSWRQMQSYIEKNSHSGDKIVLSFHNTPGSFDVLFRNISSLSLGLPVMGIWSNELFAKAANEDMAVKIITGNGVPKEKEQKIRKIKEAIGITELKDMKCDRFWFIDWDIETDVKVLNLFKDKYCLIEERKFSNAGNFDINVYYFKNKE